MDGIISYTKKGTNMSSNNGIMILKTLGNLNPIEYEWRVKQVFSIEEITHIEGKDVKKPVSLRIFEKMKDAKVFYCEPCAIEYANRLSKSLRVLEYGIKLFEVDSSWNDMLCSSLSEAEDEILYYSKGAKSDMVSKMLVSNITQTKEDILEYIEQVNS